VELHFFAGLSIEDTPRPSACPGPARTGCGATPGPGSGARSAGRTPRPGDPGRIF
jgi:hypothetical protein